MSLGVAVSTYEKLSKLNYASEITTTKANLTKVRDAKLRVLASSEKPWKAS